MARGLLLVAYDAECPPCCRRADWIRARDRRGRVVFFPLQNPELVRLAPELAGLDLHGEVHGLDLDRRTVYRGADLLAEALLRLPGWSWAGRLLRLPGLRQAAEGSWRRRTARGRELRGRQPFQDRF